MLAAFEVPIRLSCMLSGHAGDLIIVLGLCHSTDRMVRLFSCATAPRGKYACCLTCMAKNRFDRMPRCWTHAHLSRMSSLLTPLTTMPHIPYLGAARSRISLPILVVGKCYGKSKHARRLIEHEAKGTTTFTVVRVHGLFQWCYLDTAGFLLAGSLHWSQHMSV